MAPGTDWGFHYVGWEFFRRAELVAYPLGAIPGLMFPAGTTIGFTDGIPWLALPLRLLSPLLPATFQYIGLWLAACFALNGWFGARLTQAIAPRLGAMGVAVGGALFVVSPLVILHLRHEALCAHFLVIAAIVMHVRTPRWWAPVVLCAVAAGVHPYLAAMVAVLSAAAVVRWWRARSAVAGLVGIAAVCVGFGLWLGYFGAGRDVEAIGFGVYRADLSAFVSPRGNSWIFPSLPERWAVGEEGYLGLGWLLFVVSALAFAARAARLRWRSVVPLALVTGLLALYAVSPRITLFGVELVDLSGLYDHLPFVVGPFRANGRFLWPLAYLLVAGALALWLRGRPRAAPWVMAAAIVLQLVEAKGLIHVARYVKRWPVPPSSPAWELARGDYDHLAMVPPRCADASHTCCGDFTPRPYNEDQYLAVRTARLGLTLNGGGVARADRGPLVAGCTVLIASIAHAQLDPRTIYYVAPDHYLWFRVQNPRAPCMLLDGELACVSPDARGPFRDHLAAGGRRRMRQGTVNP